VAAPLTVERDDVMARVDMIQVKLIVEAGADVQEREEATTTLRRQLLMLDIDRVERASPDDPGPPDLEQVGTLLVTVGSTATAMGALVAAVRSWLAARGAGSVKIQLGADTLEIVGNLSDPQKASVAGWIKAHTTG